MQPIIDNTKVQRIPILFQLGFRIFFLSGALFCVIALFLWGNQFFHGLTINPYGASYWWHSHEMVFGFAVSIIIGFLLTAVQTWTGIPAINGLKLAGLFMIWLAARLLLMFPADIPQIFIASVDLVLLPLVAIALGYPIIVIKQWRNLVFIPILLLLFFENYLMHQGVLSQQAALSQDAAWAAVFTVILLISIMGGRVIPFFTARATSTKQPTVILWLEILANLPLLFLVIYYISAKPTLISDLMLVVISAIAALFQLIRLSRWQFWLCFKEPLLWSLHGSYIFIPLGLALLSLHFMGLEVSASQAIHSLTVGAIGGVILAMIARVSLGHTGRKLQSLSGMSIAFLLMMVAALFRSPLSALQLVSPEMSLAISFACFIIAYSIFLFRYIPIFLSKRIDGRPG